MPTSDGADSADGTSFPGSVVDTSKPDIARVYDY
jgi:hypothetical protein